MADTTDTPTPPATPAPTATPRRHSPRKPAAKTLRPTKAASATKSKAEDSSAREKQKAPAKPRSAKRATTTSKPSTRTKSSSAAVKGSDKPHREKERSGKSGGKWGTAAIAGGIAAIGAAATAALLSLRGSTPKDARKRGAHTADGTDASKSFQAGIADENSIPDKM